MTQLVALAWLAGLVGACGAATAPVTERLAQQFETLDRLGVAVYIDREDCVYLSYARGTFNRDTANPWCHVVAFGSGIPMDGQAVDDFEAIGAALRASSIRLESIFVRRDAAGAAGPGTFFVFDACTTYDFEGGPLVAEEGVLETIIPLESGWYLISSC